jgi:hypothetical protein
MVVSFNWQVFSDLIRNHFRILMRGDIMSLDDEYIDRNENVPVEEELILNEVTVSKGRVDGIAVNAGKFFLFLFASLVFSIIVIAVVKMTTGVDNLLLDGIIMWGIFYLFYKIYKN